MGKQILIIANSYFPDEPGGSSRLAFNLALGLANNGNEIWYLCQTQSPNQPEYVFQDGLHVLRYCLEPVKGLDFLRTYKHFSAVNRLLTRFLPKPPDIIHGHDLLPYVSAIKFYRGYGKSYYSVHSPGVEELAITWRAQGLPGYIKLLGGLSSIWYLEHFALTSSDEIDAKSEYTIRRMAHYYGHAIARRIRVIPGWVDTKHFKPATQPTIIQIRERLNWPIDEPVFFILRRLEARMGLDRLLQAIAMLRDEGYDFFTVIGGTGSQLKALTQLRNRLGLQSSVSFMGHISDEDLPMTYQACDASIIPTSRLECFGIIALEAMACGKPVLVTPVGALPEVVGRFEPRWIASSSTSTGLAEIIRLYLDSTLPLHEPDSIAKFIENNFCSEVGIRRSCEWLGVDDR
jgi:glycosyltransferase involved in cell wall biosynthesis